MPSLLLIEDDALIREALATALIDRGYTVLQAEDGVQGVKRFRATPTDLVLTDIVMPNMEGIALITELRRDFPQLGIIAMSGGVAHEPDLYLKIAGKFGANRTLRKPFDLPTLLAAVAEVLATTGRNRTA